MHRVRYLFCTIIERKTSDYLRKSCKIQGSRVIHLQVANNYAGLSRRGHQCIEGLTPMVLIQLAHHLIFKGKIFSPTNSHPVMAKENVREIQWSFVALL